MNSTGDGRNRIGVVLVAHPELAAKGTEAARHHSWIFNVARPPVRRDEADITDASVPVDLPHAAAAFARHEQVEVKCAFMIEGNASMITRRGAASVRNDGKQRRRIGQPQLPDVWP